MLEVARGLARLRNASLIRAAYAALSLALQPLASAWLVWDGSAITPESLAQLIAFAGLAIIIGFLIAVLAVASWILRVLAWGSVCKAKLKTFYCVTRMIVLAAPIIGLLVIIGGAVDAVLRTMISGGLIEPAMSALPETLFLYILTGVLIMATADFFEAVATLDLSLLYKVGILKVASILYLATTGVGVVAQATASAGLWSSLLSLTVFALLMIGYHAAANTVRRQLLQPSPGPAQGG
ncbi:MAG: hypothetical protein QXP94_05515 [Thermofilaceae archaeon]